jgi:hypothetical protein
MRKGHDGARRSEQLNKQIIILTWVFDLLGNAIETKNPAKAGLRASWCFHPCATQSLAVQAITN